MAKSCTMGNTIIRALFLVAKYLNCNLYLEHINRCSRLEAIVADSLSKSNYPGIRAIMKQADRFPRRAPDALINWVRNPKPDRSLGDKILADMANTTRLLFHSRKRKSWWVH